MRTFCLCCLTMLWMQVQAQPPGQWTWMSGDSTANSSGVFGTQGVPAAANKPPALYQACGVTDLDGNFWLFGGAGFDGDGDARYYNSLWKYTVATGEWTWMKGYDGAFGNWSCVGKGIPAVTNTPGARYMSAMWVDSSNNLWMFGGYGFDDGTSGAGILNDLWRYNIVTSQWTWMKGASSAYQTAVWGQQGVPDSSNTPGGKAQANAWTDRQGNLWLFGGFLHYSLTYYNDLWRYDIATNEWTWMKGSSAPGSIGSFGTLGVPDPANNPSARTCQAHWVDSAGNLWMFGGYLLFLFDGSHSISAGDDFWEYDPVSNNWIWWGHGNPPGPGTPGITCLADTSNYPRSRDESAMCMADRNGTLWMFGGEAMSISYNDLWKYDLQQKIWTRISGYPGYTLGSYGQMGVSSSTNAPASRFGGISWQDTAGNFWVFGGTDELFPDMQSDCFNDLWRFVPDSSCGVYTGTGVVSGHTGALAVFPNPAVQEVNIQLPVPTGAVLTVFNAMGQPVVNAPFAGHRQLAVAAWPPGIYWVQICSQAGCTGKKMVVVK